MEDAYGWRGGGGGARRRYWRSMGEKEGIKEEKVSKRVIVWLAIHAEERL